MELNVTGGFHEEYAVSGTYQRVGCTLGKVNLTAVKRALGDAWQESICNLAAVKGRPDRIRMSGGRE